MKCLIKNKNKTILHITKRGLRINASIIDTDEREELVTINNSA
jgi:hypothetical protein